MDTLGEALPREMSRVRDDILPLYDRIPEGRLAAMMMRQDLDAATKALAEGDVAEMMRRYESLKGYSL